MEWTDPAEVDRGERADEYSTTRGVDSPERAAQIEREKTVLSTVYYSVDQIPDSPAEPANAVDRGEGTDGELPKVMRYDRELENDIGWQASIAEAQTATAAVSGGGPVASSAAISDILAKLQPTHSGALREFLHPSCQSWLTRPRVASSGFAAPQFDSQQLGQLLSSFGPTSAPQPGPSNASLFNPHQPYAAPPDGRRFRYGF